MRLDCGASMSDEIPKVLTAEQYRRLMGQPVRESSGGGSLERADLRKIRMNKTETRYAQHLEAFRMCGEVVWYAFEPMKFRLADNTHWTPDFGVMVAVDPMEIVANLPKRITFVDVKGTRKNGKPWVEEDAQLKIKVCARLFPMFRFVQAWWWNGKWEEKEY